MTAGSHRVTWSGASCPSKNPRPKSSDSLKNGLNSFEFICLTFFNKNVNEGHEQALDRLNWIKFEFVLLFFNSSDVTVHLEMKFNRSFKLIERKPYETRLITILAIYFSSLMTIELKKLKRWLKSNLFNLPRNCNHLWLYRIEFPSGDFLVFEKKNKEI